MNSIQIRTEIYQDIDDSYCVDLYSGKKRIAYGRLALMSESEYMNRFKSFKELEIFEILTKTDHIVYLEEIEVDFEYRKQGFGRKILESLMTIYLETYPDLHIFLNALPMGKEKMSLANLISFYETVGFQTIRDDLHNAYMWKSKIS